ncbi:MAG TPA: Ig-like domain-containing protein [Gemmatimonadaceae bacterium]
MRNSLRFLMACSSLLAGCTAGDATTAVPTAMLADARSRMAANERLDAPSVLSVRLAGGSATVAWSAVADANGYQLVSCDTGMLPTVDKATATETVHQYTGLTPGVAYGVKIRSRKATSAPGGDANNSKFSACTRWIGAEPVATILLAPTASVLDVGATVIFTATLLDRFGAVLNGRDVIWTTSAPAVATVSPAGVATAVGPGQAIMTVTSEGVSATATVTVPALWRLLASRSAVPAAITASAYSAASDAIFAAEMPDGAVGSLWRFDLGTQRWTRLTANGWPMGKYRKLIYDAARHRLLTYWDGLGQVYSIPETGGTWTAEGATGNSDQYYEGYAFMNPVSGRLSLFAGYGWGSFRNTLWEWNGSNAWLAITTSGAVPEPRFGAQTNVVVDAAGARAFLTQRWLGATEGMYDDLWVLNLRTYAFRNLIPPNTGSDARGGSGMAYDPVSGTLYRYGGMTLHGFVTTSDFVRSRPDDASVRWQAMPTAATSPGPRYLPGLHYDVLRRRLILVSGLTGSGWGSDVWAYPAP